ncbi:SprB repeat-containing protein [Ekhidna sp.]|uniref:SprB repeat-containing protein n=1 Tax=Ekhidna sp. TaxID=2608089 RepID=UPI003B502EB6
MKNLLLYATLLPFIVFMGCSDNDEDPDIDCSQTDLSVAISSTVEPTCSGTGSISLMGSGGNEPYEFSINGVDFQSSSEFSGLVAGSITVTIRDSNGCTSQVNATLNSTDGISISVTTTDSDCLDASGSIAIEASGGDGVFTYSLDGGTSQSANTFSNVGSGAHEITVSDDSGCSATTDVYVSSMVSLSGDIMPLLQRECTFSGCHNGDNGANRNWTDKDNVLAMASNIKSRTQSGSMPRSPGTLTQDEIDIIACWVDDGAKDN